MLFAAAGEAYFAIGHLGFGLDLRMAQAFPSEVSRSRWLPIAVRVQLGVIDAEDVFDAAPGEFGERDFASFANLFGAGEGFVGELDLGSCHAYKLPAY